MPDKWKVFMWSTNTDHDFRNPQFQHFPPLYPTCTWPWHSAELCSLQHFPGTFNTLRPRQNGRYFPDNILKCIFLNENVWIPIEISLKFVPKDPINNIPALVQIMAWRRSGDKPLFEPMMVRLPTHICVTICVTRPQWVKPDLHQQQSTAIQGLTLSIWFTCPSRTWFWKFTCPAKIFTCPANICTSPV